MSKIDKRRRAVAVLQQHDRRNSHDLAGHLLGRVEEARAILLPRRPHLVVNPRRERSRPSPPAPPPPGGRGGSATPSRPGVLPLCPSLRRAAVRCGRRRRADGPARRWSRPRRPNRSPRPPRPRPQPAGAGVPGFRRPTTGGDVRRPSSTGRAVRAGHATDRRSSANTRNQPPASDQGTGSGSEPRRPDGYVFFRGDRVCPG